MQSDGHESRTREATCDADSQCTTRREVRRAPAWIALMVTHTHERDVPSLQQSSPPPESSHTRRSNVRYRCPRAPASPSRGIARITEAHRATCTARHPRSWWTCLTCTPTAAPHVANANETSSPHAE
eukprot:2052901-Prymnesium_polylepis.1